VIAAVRVDEGPIGIIEVEVARQLIRGRFRVETAVGAPLQVVEKFDGHNPGGSLKGIGVAKVVRFANGSPKGLF